MNTEKQTYNKFNMINECANNIVYHSSNTQEVAGYILNIIISNGGPEKYCKVKQLLITTNLHTIKNCIDEAIKIAKGMNKQHRDKYGVGFPGFRIDLQLGIDRGKYVELPKIDYRKPETSLNH